VPESLWPVLESQPWPGNVRELENVLERALILSPGPTLGLLEPGGSRGSRLVPEAVGFGVSRSDPASVGVVRFEEGVRELLQRALEATGGRIYGAAGAAALLGLKPTTLQGKLRRYGLSRRGAPA